MSKAWKDCEREVACALGGTRRVRINYSESCEDVIHPTLAIEVKYGKQVPKYPGDLFPMHDHEFIFLNSRFLHYMERGVNEFYETAPVRGGKFFRDGLAQASSYAEDKTPVLCVKKPRARGFCLVMYRKDYLAYIKRQAARPQWARQMQGLTIDTAMPGELGLSQK